MTELSATIAALIDAAESNDDDAYYKDLALFVIANRGRLVPVPSGQDALRTALAKVDASGRPSEWEDAVDALVDAVRAHLTP